MAELVLSPIEARVVAALVEKAITTPQYYPLTVNAAMLAANQKSCRNPVMTLSEGEIGAALNRLEQERLVKRDENSGRAVKWRHSFQHQMLLKPEVMGVLVTLMLRGPQTLAELRANASALNGPADHEALNAALADLADRAQPLVVQLPRAVGQSALRYAHTLCGAPTAGQSFEPEAASPVAAAPPSALAALEERVRQLEARLAQLEQSLGVPAA